MPTPNVPPEDLEEFDAAAVMFGNLASPEAKPRVAAPAPSCRGIQGVPCNTDPPGLDLFNPGQEARGLPPPGTPNACLWTFVRRF